MRNLLWCNTRIWWQACHPPTHFIYRPFPDCYAAGVFNHVNVYFAAFHIQLQHGFGAGRVSPETLKVWVKYLSVQRHSHFTFFAPSREPKLIAGAPEAKSARCIAKGFPVVFAPVPYHGEHFADRRIPFHQMPTLPAIAGASPYKLFTPDASRSTWRQDVKRSKDDSDNALPCTQIKGGVF